MRLRRRFSAFSSFPVLNLEFPSGVIYQGLFWVPIISYFYVWTKHTHEKFPKTLLKLIELSLGFKLKQ